MRVDKDDRYISEQPSKDSTPSLKLPNLFKDFPKKKLIIFCLAIVILLLLSLIIFHSARKKEAAPLTPLEVNGVTSTEKTNNAITDGQNNVGISENQTRIADSIEEVLSDNALNQANRQQPLESDDETNDSLTSSANNQNRGYRVNGHSATILNSRANKSSNTNITQSTNTKKNSHNKNSASRKDENSDLGKNIKIKNDRYVIQLSASKSVEGLKKFVKQNNITDYQIYETKHQSGSWFILIKGNYSSVDEAHKAIKALPSALQKDKPWVKSGAMINKEKASK
ncbi:hypothetical protein A9G24_00740 [Gilliamella sp. App6-5]|uniref:SPOR domain-containing protein n=1 Tax=Gilliamella sp. App6-5 TaxID=3120232 RepID=UPI00080DDFA2|nr:SPOR domain-containing protein [Gilliamella apicola]OCG15904.1 hypothetical protein A9G24_00740 [Gilliamella apicola]